MKGLLVKDFKLLENQKKLFIVFFLLMVILFVSGVDAGFVIGYCILIAAFLSVSTISYDELNNGYQFLFVLPVGRSGYAVEKYLLGLILSGGICLAATAGYTVYAYYFIPGFVFWNWFSAAALLFLTAGLMLAVMIPLHFKFGAERARVANIIVIVGFMTAINIVKELWKGFDLQLAAEQIAGIGRTGIIAAGVLLYVALLAASAGLSIRIMRKKEL